MEKRKLHCEGRSLNYVSFSLFHRPRSSSFVVDESFHHQTRQIVKNSQLCVCMYVDVVVVESQP